MRLKLDSGTLLGSVEELRQALLAWQKVYNEHWMVGRHGHRSPAQVRRDHHAAMQRMAA